MGMAEVLAAGDSWAFLLKDERVRSKPRVV
jgi:hypothetical protein